MGVPLTFLGSSPDASHLSMSGQGEEQDACRPGGHPSLLATVPEDSVFQRDRKIGPHRAILAVTRTGSRAGGEGLGGPSPLLSAETLPGGPPRLATDVPRAFEVRRSSLLRRFLFEFDPSVELLDHFQVKPFLHLQD